jgi:hypothetical protein
MENLVDSTTELRAISCYMYRDNSLFCSTGTQTHRATMHKDMQIEVPGKETQRR